jgi:hypothetical protein
MTTVFNGKEYDDRHGGPFDRGGADSYYGRGLKPHYYTGHTGDSVAIDGSKMTEKEIDQYKAGYMHNQQYGDKKVW